MNSMLLDSRLALQPTFPDVVSTSAHASSTSRIASGTGSGLGTSVTQWKSAIGPSG
jgi:hypothetical protein